MTLSRRTLVAFSALGFHIVGSSPSRAQDIAVSAIVVNVQHELTSSPLLGFNLRTSFVRAPRLSFGVEWARGSADRMGTTCSGLVPPGADCGPKPLRDETLLTLAAAEYAEPIVARSGVEVTLAAGLRAGQIRSVSNGPIVQGSQVVWGPTVGLGASWKPRPNIPLAIESALWIGTLIPFREERIIDGDAPYDAAFSSYGLRIGIGWREEWIVRAVNNPRHTHPFSDPIRPRTPSPVG